MKAKPQTGITEPAGTHGIFLVVVASDETSNDARLRRACRDLPLLARKVGDFDAKARLSAVVSFGPERCCRWFSGRAPERFQPLEPIRGPRLTAPATGGDLFIHIHSKRHDLNFELARRWLTAVGDSVRVIQEVHGFPYLDSRDLTGFIDGTANPKGRERAEVALIGNEDSAWSGGSFVLAQRYVHNLKAWSQLSEKEQVSAIGRTRRDSRELAARAKPNTAHISRVEIQEKGQEMKIVRHSMPYGRAGGESGLYFVAYARDSRIFHKMLARMYGTSGDGLHDRLMEFSRPVSGAIFFAPSISLLRSLA